VILDTFDPGGTLHPQNNLVAAAGHDLQLADDASRMATQFTIPVTGGNYQLTSITLPISVQGTVRWTLRVSLTRDESGFPGATPLEVPSVNQQR
jgi:hypothetical protein